MAARFLGRSFGKVREVWKRRDRDLLPVISTKSITDHRRAEGGRGGGQGRRPMPQARPLGSDVLHLEGEVRRYDRLGRPATEGAGAREQQAQEAVG
ncbi:hypothetical protein G6F59_018523 [Rhizopus arrhizus]|nr:hypothetical protein G6F59_018523 [Rhizopus arrhizus]